jgi:hypothetical protein
MSGMKRLKMAKKGGKINEYNAVGSPEVAEAKDQKEGFKNGGKAKMKNGGHAEGKKAKHRLDKAARGGAMKKCAAGGSPFTSAAKRSAPMKGGAGEGHVNDGPKGEDSQSDKEDH